MQFKKGIGWKACYDEERDVYTAQRSRRGFYQPVQIDKDLTRRGKESGVRKEKSRAEGS